jgi:ribosomal-protein-alanine N-acetyltransferase
MALGELGDGVVTLRAWSVDDSAWYAESVRDSEMQRFTTDPPSLTAADVAAAILALADRPEQVAYLITGARSGEPLGNIALTCTDGVGDVSYWVAAGARGRGAGTRALTLLARAALSQLGLAELRLWTHADNVASQRVAERAGFLRDPGRDSSREVKGGTWPTIAYRLSP